jgi:hypothetical protein
MIAQPSHNHILCSPFEVFEGLVGYNIVEQLVACVRACVCVCALQSGLVKVWWATTLQGSKS